jgi:hypothetical protein
VACKTIVNSRERLSMPARVIHLLLCIEHLLRFRKKGVILDWSVV